MWHGLLKQKGQTLTSQRVYPQNKEVKYLSHIIYLILKTIYPISPYIYAQRAIIINEHTPSKPNATRFSISFMRLCIISL